MIRELEDVDYLTRSVHRVRLLRLIAAGPRSREELESAVDVSHVSLVRNLDGLEERRWIARDGREYRITPWGVMVADDLGRLLDTADVTRRLSRVTDPVSREELDVEMEWFRDATVVVAETADALQPVRRWEEVISDASIDRIRIVLASVIPRTIRLAWDGREQERECEFVFDRNVMRFVTQETGLRSWLGDVLEAGHEVYRHDGELAFNLAITDGTVLFGFDHEEGGPRGLIESDDDRVREWAMTRLEQYRTGSTRVDADVLSVS